MRSVPMRRPAGQSLIELIVLLGVLASSLVAIVLLGFVGDSGIRTTIAARVAAFDCDRRPGFCKDEAVDSEANARETYSLGRFRDYVQPRDDVQLSIDLPRVDGAEKNLLLKLSEAFRNFGMKAGPLIFGLSAPDQLTRSTVTTKVWRSGVALPNGFELPTLRQSSRLALISDAWSADTNSQFAARVKAGEQPLSLLSGAASVAYFPAKDVLMPVMDAVGLESNTRAFRNAFHRVDPNITYANSRVRVP